MVVNSSISYFPALAKNVKTRICVSNQTICKIVNFKHTSICFQFSFNPTSEFERNHVILVKMKQKIVCEHKLSAADIFFRHVYACEGLMAAIASTSRGVESKATRICEDNSSSACTWVSDSRFLTFSILMMFSYFFESNFIAV